MTKVVIFDVDGTLVDTTYLHAVCWWQVFRQHDHDVAMADIHRAVGMGADQLVPHLLGDQTLAGRAGDAECRARHVVANLVAARTSHSGRP